MILVDILIPAMNKSHDFKLDENAFVVDVIDEIAGIMLTISGNGNAKGGSTDMLLCDMERGQILPLNRTLSQCNVSNGSRLMII